MEPKPSPVEQDMRAMVHEMAAGEHLTIGDVRISLLEKSGRKARLRIQCPAGADIKRVAK
jgi:hypothetical protein